MLKIFKRLMFKWLNYFSILLVYEIKITMRPVQSISQDTKNTILDKLYEQISELTKASKDGKRPYGIVSKVLNETRYICPWLTRHHIMNRMRYKERKTTSICSSIVPYTTNWEMVGAGSCARVGWPVGTTEKKRKSDEMTMVSLLNKIALQYEKE